MKYTLLFYLFIALSSTGTSQELDTTAIDTRINDAQTIASSNLIKARMIIKETQFICKKYNYTKGIAHCYYILGYINFLEGNFKVATKYIQEASDCFELLGYKKGIFNCYYQMAKVLIYDLNYIESSKYLLKSLDYSSDNSSVLISVYILLGYIQSELKDYKQAEKYFNTATIIAKRNNNKSKINLIKLYLALNYTVINDLENAYKNYIAVEKYIKATKEISKSNNHIANFLYTDFTKFYLKTDSLYKALNYGTKSRILANSLNFFDFKVESEILLGEIHLKLKDYKKSELYLVSALNGIKSISNKMSKYKAQATLILSQLYHQKKNYKLALKYAEEHRVLSDSITTLINHKKVKNLILKYENEQKDKVLEQQKVILQEQKIQALTYKRYYNTALVIIGSLAFIVIGLLQRKSIKTIKGRELDKSNILSGITHELKTPLNSIILISNLLKIEGHQSPHIDTLSFSSNYLLSYINNILTYNTSNKKEPIVLHKLKFNIKDTLQHIVKTTKLHINNNTFKTEIDEDIPNYVVGDDLKLSQILINLLNNANKYTKEGTLGLKTKLKDKTENTVTIAFTVYDTGIGILKEEQDKIYDNFYQGSRRFDGIYNGSGLGLTIVKDYIALHNSSITLMSEVNKGTTFRFDITFDMPEDNILSESSKP